MKKSEIYADLLKAHFKCVDGLKNIEESFDKNNKATCYLIADYIESLHEELNNVNDFYLECIKEK